MIKPTPRRLATDANYVRAVTAALLKIDANKDEYDTRDKQRTMLKALIETHG